MTSGRQGNSCKIYPAKYFGASPTYDHWCKVSIADIHGLKEVPGFEGQNVLFHMNHPIRFVYVVAQIVGIQDVHPKLTTLTIDDGSGSTIELKVGRNKEPDKPLETTVQNMTILSSIGQFKVRVEGQPVEVGTIVKVKGTFSSFRSQRQIDLKRIWTVKDTAEEAALWMAATNFKTKSLLQPWHLSDHEMLKIDRALEKAEAKRSDEARKTKHKEQSRVQRLEERQQRKTRYEQQAERKRLLAEQEMNKGALI